MDTKACQHETENAQKMCVELVPIFQSLEKDEMREVVNLSRHYNFTSGEVIVNPGDSEQNLYIVHQGKVKLSRITSNGKEQLIRIMGPGDFTGELSLFMNTDQKYYVTAASDANICIVKRDDFRDILMKHPLISLKVMEELSRRLDQVEDLATQFTSQEVMVRVIDYLFLLAEEQGSEQLKLPMSKKDLASYLGTTQETLSRRLSDLQKNGLIHLHGQRGIDLLNLPALEEISRNS